MYEAKVPYAGHTYPRTKTAQKQYDVSLVPLLEDMEKLWNEGERMRDQFRQEDFTLHAMILYSVTDYPGGFSLSGQVKGKKGCTICLDNTSFVHLSGSQNLVYMRSRRFLPQSHRYRRTMKKYFDNTEEKVLTLHI